MQKFNGSLVRQFPSLISGNAAAGVSVTVYAGVTGSTLATLFSGNGTGSLPNPLTTDSAGYYGFYAADGLYRLNFGISGIPDQLIQLVDVDQIRNDLNTFVISQGWIPAGSFSAGATLTKPNEILSDGANYWRWDGALPRVVGAGSSPSPTGVGAWLLVGDAALRSELAVADSSVIIAGITAAQVAAAADIAAGNFVTPEQFFSGDVNDTNADWLSACNAALATGRRVLLRRIYGLSSQLNIPANGLVSGTNRQTTGFKRVGSSAAGGVIAFSGDNVTLSNFRVDAMNIGSAPSNRLNAVSVNGSAKNFNISQVDAYNATGYGHVTFGSESNPQVTGVYLDCRSENCEVLFEQIGALDVTLYRCIGVGTAGRTTDMFHPYAGSKRVTYIDSHASGSSSGGITATTTNGFPLGPFTFINSSIDITGGGSAVVTSTVSGAAANTDLYFFGGLYRSSGGQSATLQTRGIFKAFGTRFEGLGGFNCPAVPAAEIDLELNGCQLVAAEDNAGAVVFSLITNGCNPRIIGGSIEAYNNLAGGKQAVLGNAIISRETRLIPVAASQQVNFLAETAGSVALTVDAATLGLAVISLPVNATREKLVVALSVSNNSDNYLSQNDRISWAVTGSGSSITVRYGGNDPTNLRLHYRIGVLP